MIRNQSENDFRGGGGGGGVRGKSRSSEDVYTRSQLEAAGKESFFARRMAENETKPEGRPPSQRGKYVGFGSSSGHAPMSNQQDDVFSVVSQGFGRLSMVAAYAAQSAASVVQTGTKEFTSKAEKQKYIGMFEDCCCDYETVNKLNTEVLHPLLQDLVKTPFYRYFKVKLWCDCPFWPDDGMCRLRDCSVCECLESEFPEPFKNPLSKENPVCQEGKP